MFCIYQLIKLCSFPNNEFPFEFDGDNLVGYDFAVNQPKCQIEHKHDRQSYQKMDNSFRKETYEYKSKPWHLYDDVKDNNFEPLVKMIIDKNESFNTIDSAGAGKSHLINRIYEFIRTK